MCRLHGDGRKKVMYFRRQVQALQVLLATTRSMLEAALPQLPEWPGMQKSLGATCFRLRAGVISPPSRSG